MEKQLTTPQQYPLTLNALTTAANQSTNRDPVVDLSDDDVLGAVDELRAEHLLRVVLPSHGRSVKRYRQVLDEVWGLDAPRYGLLAALLLRGPQTVGELRARTERMVDVPSLGDVQALLAGLAEHSEGLVRLLARRPGQKEDRWEQIVAAPWTTGRAASGGDEVRPGPTGRTSTEGVRAAPSSGDRAPERNDGGAPDDSVRPGGATSDRSDETSDRSDETSDRSDELADLRGEVAVLREAVSALRQDLDELRRGLGG